MICTRLKNGPGYSHLGRTFPYKSNAMKDFENSQYLLCKSPSMRPQQHSLKKGGYKKHAPTPGSTLPRSMQEELDEQGERLKYVDIETITDTF